MKKLVNFILWIILFYFLVYLPPLILINYKNPEIGIFIFLFFIVLSATIMEAFSNLSASLLAFAILGLGIGLLIYTSHPNSLQMFQDVTSGLGTEFLGIFLTIIGVDKLNRLAEKERDQNKEKEIRELSIRIAKLQEYIMNNYPQEV